MILSTGYITDETIIWEIEADQLDFSLTEFDELIAGIKLGNLFEYLEENRPALKSRLLGLFANQLSKDEIDEEGLEYELEDRLRALSLKLRRG